MSPSTLSRITHMIRQVSPATQVEITPASRLRADLALDSVAAMELLSLIDDELGLFLEMEDVFGVETVADIVALAEARTAARAGAPV